jgi:hypothetical protein
MTLRTLSLDGQPAGLLGVAAMTGVTINSTRTKRALKTEV